MGMNVFEAVSSLRIVRKYQEKEVDEKVVGLILHMANYVLSSGNLQPWEFVVVDDAEEKKKLGIAALKLEHVAKAPLCIVLGVDIKKVGMKYGTRGEVLYAVEDGAQAAAIIAIIANALGLGCDIVRAFDEIEVSGTVNFPDSVRPIAIITLGYPAEEGEVPQRAEFEDRTHVNLYGNKIHGGFEPLKEHMEKVLGELKIRAGVRKPADPKEILKKLFRKNI